MKNTYNYFLNFNILPTGIAYYLLILLIIVCSQYFLMPNNAYAQEWQFQNPVPTADGVTIVQFIDKKHGWMATDGPMLLKTTDGGKTWNGTIIGLYIDAMSFVNPRQGWIVARKEFGNIRRGVFHTSDGGITWVQQIGDTTETFLQSYTIAFLDSLNGWTVRWVNGYENFGGQLLHTTDGGKTWEVLPYSQIFNNYAGPIGKIYFYNSLRGWVVGYSKWGIKTYDGGATWEADTSLAGIIYITFGDSLHGWASSDYSLIKRTTDGGKTWENITFKKDGSPLRVNDIYALDDKQVFLLSRDLYYSSDGGITWQLYSDLELESICFIDSAEAWGGKGGYSGNGYYHTIDQGKTWESGVRRIGEWEEFTEVEFVTENTGWVAGYRNSTNECVLFKTTDGGNLWQQQFPPFEAKLFEKPFISDMVFIDENNGWLVTGSHPYTKDRNLLYTKDGGLTWDKHIFSQDVGIREIAFFDSLNGWAAGKRVLRTMDGGKTWTDKTPSDELLDSLNCSNLVHSSSFADSLHGWIICLSKNNSSTGYILYTNNGGDSWQKQYTVYVRTNGNISCTDSSHVWVYYYPVLLSSSNGGKSWQENSCNLLCNTLKFFDKSNGWLSGFHGAIYKTTDSGITWQKQPVLTMQELYDIDFPDNENGWVVGSNAAILHYSTGQSLVISNPDEIVELKQSCELYPNYPNPFNPETTISFNINLLKSHVKLEIFDMLGRKVTTLVDKDLKPGKYHIKWKGLDCNKKPVPSGVYLYHLKAGNNIMSGKMILVR